jgi:hypothetical protein
MYPEPSALLGTMQVPQKLKELLWGRYDGSSDAYQSEYSNAAGCILNECMLNPTLLDAEEEIVDAIFNLLVLKLKTGEDIGGLAKQAIDLWCKLDSLRS